MRCVVVGLLAAGLLSSYLSAQSLERRIYTAKTEVVRMSFAARPGVCGSGPNSINVRSSTEEWDSGCDGGPVRVALRIHQGRAADVRTYVGGHWREQAAATDLGSVRPAEAASFLIGLAERGSEDAILPATLADSINIGPDLLRVARNRRVDGEVRKRAVFWLSQAAGAAIAGTLDSIATDPGSDREIRKQAVFALSQRSEAEGVPALIRIARTNRDPEIRKSALFWLGQSEDPRALDLFEDILR
jgi:HEAT repeats